MSNEEPIQLMNSANNPCIDALILNMSINENVVDDSTQIEAEHDAMKLRLKSVARSYNTYTGKGKQHWQELRIDLCDESVETKVRINLAPYRYSSSTDKFGHNFFSLTISRGFTENILQQLIGILRKVLGIYFDKLREHARISRIDLAFDFDMDINCVDFNGLYFTGSHFQISSVSDRFINFSRGANLSSYYLGGKRGDQIVIYDRGMKLLKKGKKLDNLRGICVRIELRLRPRSEKTYTLDNILCAHTRVAELLERFSVFRLKSLRRVTVGDTLHLFLMACKFQGYKAVITAVRKYSKGRAKWIERQFTKVSLDHSEMRSRLFNVLDNFADHFGPPCNAEEYED